MKLIGTACLLAAIAASAHAGSILFTNFDSSYTLGGLGVTIGGGSQYGNAGEAYAMQFTLTTSGTVTGLQIAAWCDYAPCALNVSLATDKSGVPDSLLGTVALTGIPIYGGVEQGSMASGPTLTAGTLYWAVVAAQDPVNGLLAWYHTTTSPLAVDAWRLGTGTWTILDNAWAEELEIDGNAAPQPTGVPEPTSIVSVGSGGLLLLGFCKRMIQNR